MNDVLSEKGTGPESAETACFDEREVIRTRRPKPPPNGPQRMLSAGPCAHKLSSEICVKVIL